MLIFKRGCLEIGGGPDRFFADTSVHGRESLNATRLQPARRLTESPYRNIVSVFNIMQVAWIWGTSPSFGGSSWTPDLSETLVNLTRQRRVGHPLDSAAF